MVNVWNVVKDSSELFRDNYQIEKYFDELDVIKESLKKEGVEKLPSELEFWVMVSCLNKKIKEVSNLTEQRFQVCKDLSKELEDTKKLNSMLRSLVKYNLSGLDEKSRMILFLISEGKSFRKISSVIGLTLAPIHQRCVQLQKKGLLKKQGEGKFAKWILTTDGSKYEDDDVWR